MTETTEKKEEHILVRIDEDMKNCYIDYAMSVIIGRALPDVRDGLKPVHRRILYAMQELGNQHNKAYKKSARIVGDVIGKYHPHGDTAVYDAIVRMAQDFSLRYPLIDGQGNFGSIDGDSAAAMRYTEIRMEKIAEDLLADIDKETVTFIPNYDESQYEPSVLPAQVPNLLINGVAGIAVGMATNVPPHNLREVVDGVIALLENSNLDVLELMEFIKGPDLPTGAIINGLSGIYDAYRTGRGTFQMRGRAEVIEGKKSDVIIITEIPFQINKAKLVEKIAHLVRDKVIVGISELRDESDKEGIRIVIELKNNASGELVLNQLYKHTRLQENFSINFIAIVDQKPKQLGLKEYLQCFIDFRLEIVTKRTEFLLRKSKERAHILRGYKTAIDNIDAIVKLIRESENSKAAQDNLIEQYDLDEIQARAILDMRLARLTGMEREKVESELLEEERKIEEFLGILRSEEKKKEIIKEELMLIREKYPSERRSEINNDEVNYSNEDLIPDDTMVITISHRGYIKRMPLEIYRSQKRGGKGISVGTKDDDMIIDLIVASNHQRIFFFTNTGRVFSKKVWELPKTSRTANGTPVVNYLQLKEGEAISSFVPMPKDIEGKDFIFATEKGMVKRVESSQFSSINVSGKIAIQLKEGDRLVDVKIYQDEAEYLLLASKKGQALRFKGSALRKMGRVSIGVSSLLLAEGDSVIGMIVAKEEDNVLTISENGYGKRSPVSEYREVNRRGKGVRNMKVSEKTGEIVTIKLVEENDEIMVMTEKGQILRSAVSAVSIYSRNAQGVRVMKLNEGDKVFNVARVAEEFQEKEPENDENESDSETDSEAKAGEETEKSVPKEGSEGEE